MVKSRNTRDTKKQRGNFWPFVCLAAFAVSLSALAVPPNRWLIVVETSRAMQPRREATAQLMGNLILSGMNGQLHAGDTIGVWTFNNALHSGEISLQVWSPKESKTIAERASLFLATCKFERTANFGAVLPAMGNVVSNSDFITIVLICSGTSKIQGTPYDDAINTLEKKFQSAQEKAGMPFVIALRAQDGRVVDFKVNTPPLALEFPPLPPELLATNVVAQKTAEPKPVVAPPPAPMGQPLIVHGKKPEPEPEIKSNPPVTLAPATNAVANLVTDALAQTQSNVAVTTNPPIANTQAPQPQIANAASNAPVMNEPKKSSRETMLWVGGMFAGGAVVALFFALRRSRKESHPSLITRSLNRDKE